MVDNERQTELLQKSVQDILENDLTCAVCHEIYINPLILNCSHSFCKFCLYQWLASKKSDCPQCRVRVIGQAENLALRNIINKLVQTASPAFKLVRTNVIAQRLKDQEEQIRDINIDLEIKRLLKRSTEPNQTRERTRFPLTDRLSGPRWGSSPMPGIASVFNLDSATDSDSEMDNEDPDYSVEEDDREDGADDEEDEDEDENEEDEDLASSDSSDPDDPIHDLVLQPVSLRNSGISFMSAAREYEDMDEDISDLSASQDFIPEHRYLFGPFDSSDSQDSDASDFEIEELDTANSSDSDGCAEEDDYDDGDLIEDDSDDDTDCDQDSGDEELEDEDSDVAEVSDEEDEENEDDEDEDVDNSLFSNWRPRNISNGNFSGNFSPMNRSSTQIVDTSSSDDSTDEFDWNGYGRNRARTRNGRSFGQSERYSSDSTIEFGSSDDSSQS